MDMQFEFVRKMPLPQELIRDYPLTADLRAIKARRDREIADILTVGERYGVGTAPKVLAHVKEVFREQL